jgi:hypothetical protein
MAWGGTPRIARLDTFEDALVGSDRVFWRMASQLMAAHRKMEGIARAAGSPPVDRRPLTN